MPGTSALSAIALLACCCAAAQDFSKVQIEKVAAGYQFTEGPAWSPDGFLLFSDVPSNRIIKLQAGEKPAVYRADSNGANGNAFDAQGRLYTCEAHSRRVTRTDRKGRVETIAEAWSGKKLNAPNDITVRKDGQVYFTDPAFGNESDARALDFYGVYHITPKGALSLVAQWKTRPNGIALSPDGHLLYVANSDDRTIHVYDLDRAGAASNDRVLVKDIAGVPDGIRTDERGNIYVAARGIVVYSPDGRQIADLPMAETPANCTFGDGDLKTLYITARTSVYRVRLDVKGSAPYANTR